VKRVSLWRRLFVLRVRRIFPAFHYLDVIEDHKNGSYHLHFAVTGVPRDVDPKLTGHVIGRHWYALGGGRVDMAAPPGRDHAGAMGWYLGKYLAKRQEQRMARGHRRWGRSGGFAPEVVMAWSQKWRKRFGDERSAAAQAQARAEAESNPRADSVCGVVGWWHPLLPSVARVRVWMDPPPETVGT
jgi:hypothetical protein